MKKRNWYESDHEKLKIIGQETIDSVKELHRNKKAFGHFIAIGMGVAATLVLFGFMWPAAKTMMTGTVNSMNQLNSQMVSSLNGLTVSVTSSTTLSVTFNTQSGASAPTGVTASDFSISVNGTPYNLSSTTPLSGTNPWTLTLATGLVSGDTITVTLTVNGNTYSGTGTY